jgi:serine/threonine protein phosphatase PrpC
VVTRALGTGDETEADYWLLPVEEGDRILVCSDGLTGELTDDHIYRILSTVGHPQDAADALIQAALRSGGRDNVTVIVVDARNVLNDAGAATTAPRPEPAEDETTLPRTATVESGTAEPGGVGPEAAEPGTAHESGEPGDDRR